MRTKRIWSPIELEFLKENKHISINQLTIKLARSRNAISNKIKELDGKPILEVVNKNNRSKIGKRPDCDNLYFRSSWESNFYRILKLDKNIILIEYEPVDFTFWQFGIKKGTISYTPDFRITYKDGTSEWIEVKGNFLKQTDKTKIRRFKKYFPEEASRLIALAPSPKSKTTKFFLDEKIEVRWFYTELKKQHSKTLANWE